MPVGTRWQLRALQLLELIKEPLAPTKSSLHKSLPITNPGTFGISAAAFAALASAAAFAAASCCALNSAACLANISAAAFAAASRMSASCCQVGPLIGNGAKLEVLSSVNCQISLLLIFTHEYRSRSLNCCDPDCLQDVPAIVFVAELGTKNVLARDRTSEATSHLIFRTL